MPIRILKDEVAIKIAAGEVIERPASVAKELIENAIDAGAQSIHVRVRQGGRRLIQVADDGSGIPAGEVELAFARHATSKLWSVDDLDHIATLGFRGEALASIAAVAQVTLLTRAQDDALGTRLRIEGSDVIDREPHGHPRGTTLSVENLFYNVPARLKFLRTDATERKHIDNLVIRYAMAYPALRFVLENDDRLTFRSPGNGSLFDVLIEVYGLETAEAMIEVGSDEQADKGPIRVSGYVSEPHTHRSNRDYITLFVNGRWVQDYGLTFAVEQAYHTLLPANRHPLGVLRIELSPGQVDVNVHPTKSKVKFRQRNAVFRAVQRTVRETLIANAPIPQAQHPAAQWGVEGWQERRDVLVGAGATQRAMDLIPPRQDRPILPDAAPEEQEPLPPLRVLGQLAQTYIIAEGPEGMYLVDQHAAHERVLYEQLLDQQAESAVPTQSLLEPLPVELTPAQSQELAVWLPSLNRLGFEVEPFGGTTVLVRTLPAILARADVRQLMASLLDELSAGQDPLAQERDARAAAAACKRGAAKAGQTLSMPEMESLIRQLEETRSPRTCPHGRPTMILLSQGWMEREFGRR